MIRGLDISHFQGDNLDVGGLVRKYDLDFVGIKATEGTSYTDPQFADNLKATLDAGAVPIPYHYAHPELSVAAQLDHFLTVVKPRSGMALTNDLERGTTQAATHDWAAAWGAGIRKSASMCASILYCGHGYASTDTARGLAHYYDYWWYPRYPSSRYTTIWPVSFSPLLEGNTTGWLSPQIWQWTQGFASKYDADLCTLTRDQLVTPSTGDDPVTPADMDALIARLLATQIPLADGSGTRSVAGALAWCLQFSKQSRDAVGVTNASLAGVPGDVQAAVSAALASDTVNVQVTVAGKDS